MSIHAAEFDHFVKAQANIYGQVLHELAQGQKRSHWMWFIFPQLRGLGQSAMSEAYAIQSIAQAKRYLEHPLLGPRLIECAQAVLNSPAKTVQELFGYPDWLKFRSSMTLFSLASPESSVFTLALDKFFGGEPDERTLQLLRM